MPNAQELVVSLRSELAPLSDKIRRHPYIDALAAGAVPRERLRLFAAEQYHIVRNDLRSFARLLSREEDYAVQQFLLGSVSYEAAAFGAVFDFAAGLAMSETELQAYEPMPGAHAYTAFLGLIASHGSAAEMAGAFVIDLEGWGGNCGAMSRILKERYGFTADQVRFFDHFAAADPDFEPRSLAVIDLGLAAGVEPRSIRRAARLMLEYELMYWDTIHAASRNA